jgi:uncharacterized protein (TIGR02271 family)
MSRTITAMFNDRSEAEAAAAQLRSQTGAEARIIDESSGSSGSSSGEQSSGGFWSDLKDIFVADDDRATYEEGVRRGHFMLCANVPEEQADRACSLIESAGAVDVDENEQQWRSEGWAGSSGIREQSSSTSGQAAYGSSSQMDRSTESSNIVEEERIPVVEEQLRVGKREVERGGARVRSYVEERPVSEQVNLREEHVNIERRPVDQTISPDALDRNGLLQDREIEMRETSEEAIIGKEARVAEEVVVQKTANQHSEQVQDTVRNTRVEVDENDSSNERGALGFERGGNDSSDAETARERSPELDRNPSGGRF